MHIPDGFISVTTAAVTYAASGASIAYGTRRTSAVLNERQVPLMGVSAAFVFAATVNACVAFGMLSPKVLLLWYAITTLIFFLNSLRTQMLNFHVVGGTSGHLLGGALAAILLGPWAGMLVITSVLAVQALIFQDGGLLALGANVLNMAVVGVLVGYGAYRVLIRLLGRGRLGLYGAGFGAGWLSVVVASLLAAVEIAASGVLAWGLVVPAMVGIHALIGIGEGLITVGVLAFLALTRPDLLGRSTPVEVRA